MLPTMPIRVDNNALLPEKISIFANCSQLILTKSCIAYQQIMQVGKRRLPTHPDSVCLASAVVSLRYSCEKCCLAKRKYVPSNNPGLSCQRCYARKLPCFNAGSQQGRRNDLPYNNYLESATLVVLTLNTQHHDVKKTGRKAIMRKTSPENIDLESIPTKPTRVANDNFLPDVLVRNALVSDQLDQRSS